MWKLVHTDNWSHAVQWVKAKFLSAHLSATKWQKINTKAFNRVKQIRRSSETCWEGLIHSLLSELCIPHCPPAPGQFRRAVPLMRMERWCCRDQFPLLPVLPWDLWILARLMPPAEKELSMASKKLFGSAENIDDFFFLQFFSVVLMHFIWKSCTT